ncbi:hypothetical protein BDV39DRAFT_217430 [Aspergillus sergii]|uniref:Uncharacterized protein n=1 Tax=Aspergillus sergii TaxID=1034303 RepID=A0A5N6WT53_9EURO|nr:hypothetical protein BDV39DRAFT_217430 [Aspergillus sergii]
MSSRTLGLGIIGAGDVFQVCHGPAILLLSHLFKIESICDVSAKTVDHSAAKFSAPHKTTTAQEVIDHPKVEVVLILTSDESHAPLALASLKAGKNVFIEKPVTLSLPSLETIIEAEKNAPNGARVFVGYMRRYAASFREAFKREIASIPKILYARVRDFSGPNTSFINQSGTFPVKNFDYPAGSAEERNSRLDALYAQAFPGQEITAEKQKFCRFLGSLGSHDISLMREALGVPESVDGVSVNDPFYSAIMTFRNPDGSTYSTTYESGIDEVPVFDAHITVYGAKKRVTINYDSPYVKGLPIYVEVDETNEQGEVQHRSILSSYEDAYTAELKELYDAFAEGKPIKTTVSDAREDLQIFDMMYKRWNNGQ